jgi:hypothetical protein
MIKRFKYDKHAKTLEFSAQYINNAADSESSSGARISQQATPNSNTTIFTMAMQHMMYISKPFTTSKIIYNLNTFIVYRIHLRNLMLYPRDYNTEASNTLTVANV